MLFVTSRNPRKHGYKVRLDKTTTKPMHQLTPIWCHFSELSPTTKELIPADAAAH